ncbi:MAG: hypothetical protein DLM50_06420 [Candidatus Meridianibacter frigidus]|nr:MAG: hypothetical protein DLM50_06420 [Candidatus Eremiobacteraeota bacterium]
MNMQLLAPTRHRANFEMMSARSVLASAPKRPSGNRSVCKMMPRSVVWGPQLGWGAPLDKLGKSCAGRSAF